MPKPRWMHPRWNPSLGKVKTEYLLYDDFLDGLAAGAVNNTYATPPATAFVRVPNKRTVVDTNTPTGLLSISGGNLVFAGGKATPGWGDPGAWYPAVTRVAGRMLVLKYSTSSGTSITAGLGTAAGGLPGENGIYPMSTGVRLYNTATPVIADIASSLSLNQVLIAMRAVGAVYFLKNNSTTFPTWTLLYTTVVGSTAALYPGIGNYNAIASFDYIRIPVSLWLPSPILSDSFAQSNGALGGILTNGLGHAETTGIGSGGAGVTWHGYAWTVATNKAVGTPVLGAELATGALVVGNRYSITATQANYFYTGCAIGNTFRATATTALDANNKVKLMARSSQFASVVSSVADVFASVDVVCTAGTQVGLLLNSDSSFHARINKAGGYASTATEIILDEVTKAITNADTITIRGAADTTYAITSVGALSGTGQTITLTSGLVADIADDVEIGVDYATPSYMLAYHDGTNAHLDKVVDGVATALINTAATYSASAAIKVWKLGTAYRLYYNNALVGTQQTVASMNGLYHGLFSTYASNTLDNFVVYSTTQSPPGVD